MLRALDRRLPRGSEIVVLSEKSLAWRKEKLADEGVLLSGGSMNEAMSEARDQQFFRRPDVEGDDSQPRRAEQQQRPRWAERRQERRAEKGEPEGDDDEEGAGSRSRGGDPDENARHALRNARLVHRVGITTDHVALKKLPLERAVAVVVAADVDDYEMDTQVLTSLPEIPARDLRAPLPAYAPSSPPTLNLNHSETQSRRIAEAQISDSEVITSAMLLRSMLEKCAALECKRRGRPADEPVTLCIEFRDVLTRRLLLQQPALLDPPATLAESDAEWRPHMDLQQDRHEAAQLSLVRGHGRPSCTSARPTCTSGHAPPPTLHACPLPAPTCMSAPSPLSPRRRPAPHTRCRASTPSGSPTPSRTRSASTAPRPPRAQRAEGDLSTLGGRRCSTQPRARIRAQPRPTLRAAGGGGAPPIRPRLTASTSSTSFTSIATTSRPLPSPSRRTRTRAGTRPLLSVVGHTPTAVATLAEAAESPRFLLSAAKVHRRTSHRYVMRHLLDAYGGVDVCAIPAAAVLGTDELLKPMAFGSRPSCAFSFHDISRRCSECGAGVLIGWRRQRRGAAAARNFYEGSRSATTPRTPSAWLKRHFSRGEGHLREDTEAQLALAEGQLLEAEEPRTAESEPEINPVNKERKRGWMPNDTLLLLVQHSQSPSTGVGELAAKGRQTQTPGNSHRGSQRQRGESLTSRI